MYILELHNSKTTFKFLCKTDIITSITVINASYSGYIFRTLPASIDGKRHGQQQQRLMFNYAILRRVCDNFFRETTTPETSNHHTRIQIQPFSILRTVTTVGWRPENFVLISLTIPELSCWQTDGQTDRQTDTQTDTTENNTTAITNQIRASSSSASPAVSSASNEQLPWSPAIHIITRKSIVVMKRL